MKINKVTILILGIITTFFLSISGCATFPVGPAGVYYMTVDSIALPGADIKDKTYILSSAMKNVGDQDIRYKEFAKYIENALAKTGYQRLDGGNANLIIRLAYGIGKPETQVSTETYTTAAGYSYRVGWTWINVPPQSTTVTTKNTTYERFLILEAYDSKDRRSQLWRTTVISKGRSSDLRVVLPHMIAAATYYFGKDSKGKINRVMYQNAPLVLDIMRTSDTHNEAHFTGKERLGIMLERLAFKDRLTYQDQKTGILVTGVAENSIAQKMGLRKYDIVLAVNGKIVTEPQMILDKVQNTRPGGEIQLTFFSWNALQEVSATGRLN